MKKKLTILLTVLLLLTCVPAQSNAGALFDKVSNAVSKIHQKVDSAFSKVKAKFTKSDNKKAEEALIRLDNEYSYDKNFYHKHNMNTKSTLNKLGYESIIHTHTLEKGMEHFELRPFAVKKTAYIMNLLKRESKFKNYKNTFAYINGVNSLREYKKIYEEHNWKDKDEYKKVSNFLKDYKKVEQQKAGAYIN